MANTGYLIILPVLLIVNIKTKWQQHSEQLNNKSATSIKTV